VAFNLLRSKFTQVSEKIKDLEADEGSSRQERAWAREQVEKMQKEAESVIKILAELDINPDSWDDKLYKVKVALMANMTGSHCRRAVFQWWENMAHSHVGSMSSTVTTALDAGEFGLKVKAPDSSSLGGTWKKMTVPTTS